MSIKNHKDILKEISELGAVRNDCFDRTTVLCVEGNRDEALISNDEVLSVAEEYRLKIKELADYYNTKGKKAKALDLMNLYESKKHFDTAHYSLNLGIYPEKQDEAIAYYTKAAEMGYPCYNNIAVIYDCLGDVDKAEKYYLMAIRHIPKLKKYGIASIDGNEKLAYRNLALLYDETRNTPKTIKYYWLTFVHTQDSKCFAACAITAVSYMLSGFKKKKPRK